MAELEALAGARVGVLVDRWDPRRGGGEAALAALAGELTRLGAQPVIVAARVSADGVPAGARVETVDVRGITRAAREGRQAEALVRGAERAGCDVTVGMRHLPTVDLYWPHGGSHAASLAARRRSRGQRVDAPARGRHRVFLQLEEALLGLGGARRVACVSRLVERELADAFPLARERLVLVPNGVDLARFRPAERLEPDGRGRVMRGRLGVGDGESLVLFSAREPRLKGLEPALEALAALRDRPFRLLVAGVRRPGPWERLARARGLADRTRFLSEADPVALASAADLALLPTFRDTCSLVALECLACGTPVVTTARAGAAEAIGDPRAGAVVSDPLDHEALVAAVAERLDPPAAGDADRRDAVRTCVTDRSSEAWLNRLAAEVAILLNRT